MLVVLLVISIVIANSFIIFSNGSNRFYFAKLTTSVTSGIALALALVMVYKYKTKQDKYVPHQSPIRENIMHFSICIFLALWFVAQLTWSFYEQQSPAPSVPDILWLIGYAFFGYFLYRLLYLFRKQLEFSNVAIISIIVTISLTYIILIILSVSNLLTVQKQQVSVTILTLGYPVLDAILLVPAALIFWVRRNPATFEHKSSAEQQEDISWILLSLSMILFAIGDSGFAYISALNLTIQNEVWIWNLFYNSGYLCLAAALTRYATFLDFTKVHAAC